MTRGIEKKLHDFIDVLRDANVAVSTDEILSLFDALQHIPLGERRVFKQALQTTLIKEHTDIPVFERCFENFFGVTTGTAAEDEIRSLQSADALPMDDLKNLDRALAEFIEGMNEKLLFTMTPENIISMFLENLEAAGDSGGIGLLLFKIRGNLSSARMQRSESSAEPVKEITETLLKQILKQRLKKIKIGAEVKKREDYLLNKFIYQLTMDEIREMREMVRRFGQKLKNRVSLRKKKVTHGHIDIKRTIRMSLQYGAIPFKIKYKDRKIDRPQLVVLCDVSGSVNQYTRFMLLLTHTLQSLFSKVRTFAFISTLVEITPLFMEMDPERAIQSIFDDTDFTYGWGTNYGRSFDLFIENFSGSLNKKTTVLILGDARNNNQDPGLDSFIKIRERSRNLYWLNPEKRHLWNWNDSITAVYMPYCSDMKEVNNIYDLSNFVDKLFSGYKNSQ